MSSPAYHSVFEPMPHMSDPTLCGVALVYMVPLHTTQPLLCSVPLMYTHTQHSLSNSPSFTVFLLYHSTPYLIAPSCAVFLLYAQYSLSNSLLLYSVPLISRHSLSNSPLLCSVTLISQYSLSNSPLLYSALVRTTSANALLLSFRSTSKQTMLPLPRRSSVDPKPCC